MASFPVVCASCGKRVEPLYRAFQVKLDLIRERSVGHGWTAAEKTDRIAGALDGLRIHNICCRALFLTHVDNTDDAMAATGDLYRRTDKDVVGTPGEIGGSVKIVRKPHGRGERKKPTVLYAR